METNASKTMNGQQLLRSLRQLAREALAAGRQQAYGHFEARADDLERELRRETAEERMWDERCAEGDARAADLEFGA